MAVITERWTEDGIAKPLPPEWFIQKDTSAEMRWEAPADQDWPVAARRKPGIRKLRDEISRVL